MKTKLFQDLFTWRWGTPDRWGNMWQVTPPPYKQAQVEKEVIMNSDLLGMSFPACDFKYVQPVFIQS